MAERSPRRPITLYKQKRVVYTSGEYRVVSRACRGNERERAEFRLKSEKEKKKTREEERKRDAMRFSPRAAACAGERLPAVYSGPIVCENVLLVLLCEMNSPCIYLCIQGIFLDRFRCRDKFQIFFS